MSVLKKNIKLFSSSGKIICALAVAILSRQTSKHSEITDIKESYLQFKDNLKNRKKSRFIA